jgi:hypothetical protein
MQIGEILRLRSDFEDITSGYSMPAGSDIDTINWFIENGHRSNSLRNGFDDAKKIAQTIKEYYDGTKNTGTRQ